MLKRKSQFLLKLLQRIKRRVEAIFDELDLSLSTAINIFIKKSIAEGGLPFEVKDPFYSEVNQAELNRRFKKIDSNQ